MAGDSGNTSDQSTSANQPAPKRVESTGDDGKLPEQAPSEQPRPTTGETGETAAPNAELARYRGQDPETWRPEVQAAEEETQADREPQRSHGSRQESDESDVARGAEPDVGEPKKRLVVRELTDPDTGDRRMEASYDDPASVPHPWDWTTPRTEMPRNPPPAPGEARTKGEAWIELGLRIVRFLSNIGFDDHLR